MYSKSVLLFGLQTDFYLSELSRVRVAVEFQSATIQSNLTIIFWFQTPLIFRFSLYSTQNKPSRKGFLASIRSSYSAKHISAVHTESDERFTTLGTFANVAVIKNLYLFSNCLVSESGKILFAAKQISAQSYLLSLAPTGKQSIIAYSHKSFWKYVQQKTRYKLFS